MNDEDEAYDSFVQMEKKANLTQMIIDKAHQIEENMKMDSVSMKKIDMSVIEDLKRRRLEQRYHNEAQDGEDN